MDNAQIAHTPRSDATPEAELTALAAVYAFILECHAKKRAAEGSGGDDNGKGEQHVPATVCMP
jgi:hypothetical protein